MKIESSHSVYEIEAGDKVTRSDRLGPTMVVDDVFEEAEHIWLTFKCVERGERAWPATMFVPA
jgi:hypothetical protein